MLPALAGRVLLVSARTSASLSARYRSFSLASRCQAVTTMRHRVSAPPHQIRSLRTFKSGSAIKLWSSDYGTPQISIRNYRKEYKLKFPELEWDNSKEGRLHVDHVVSLSSKSDEARSMKQRHSLAVDYMLQKFRDDLLSASHTISLERYILLRDVIEEVIETETIMIFCAQKRFANRDCVAEDHCIRHLINWIRHLNGGLTDEQKDAFIEELDSPDGIFRPAALGFLSHFQAERDLELNSLTVRGKSFERLLICV